MQSEQYLSPRERSRLARVRAPVSSWMLAPSPVRDTSVASRPLPAGEVRSNVKRLRR
jgi:hypothetical protein